ncbi:MAG: ABC transporter permease [Butyribacter sp.]|nr:ABC transporter permease subunit [bacterium]MDY3853341.1 ABC transporter permease [Butyribacter sp.]
MLAIYKKELRQYFNSMIGFVFLAFFLVIVGIYTWAYNLASGLGNFELTLDSIYFLFVLLIPILTMRIVAEENHQRTDQLLYTAPVSVTKIIIAKYLAVLTLFTIGVAVISVYPLILSQYGSDVRLATAYSSLIGFYLFGAACIAIGVFISSLTESQAIAAVVSFIVLLLTFLLSNITDMIPTDSVTQCTIIAVVWIAIVFLAYNSMHNVTVAASLGIIGEIVIWVVYFVKASLYESLVNNILNILAISTRYEDFSLGILNYDSIVYYVSISVLFVFLTIQTIKKKRFS